MYLLSGKYHENVTRILGSAAARLPEKKLERFSTLLSYYHSMLGPEKGKERQLKLVQKSKEN